MWSDYNTNNRMDESEGKVCVNYKPDAEFVYDFDDEGGKKTDYRLAIAIVASLTAVILAVVISVICISASRRSSVVQNNEGAALTAEQTTDPVPQETVPVVAAVPDATETPVQTQEPTAAPTPEPVRRGTAEPIPQDIREYMTGKSYRANNNITLDQLSYLTIPHYDFNYNVTYGHLVVNASVAEDVLDIFAELFDIRYPIERMTLVDDYGASDFQSIEANNTSAFNYRESTDGSGSLSKHALGLAIDINPQINPYVNSSGTGSHSNAREYWNRDISTWTSDIAKAAYIGPDTEIYRIFISHGWSWGGNWSTYRDYQHFTK